MNFKKKCILLMVIAIIIALCTGGLIYALQQQKKDVVGEENNTDSKLKTSAVDTWEYKPGDYDEESAGGVLYSVSGGYTADSVASGVSTSTKGTSWANNSASSESYLGYTVGGAQNIKNFRENIKNGYLPLSTDITYNGLYSEYYFDTGVVNRNHDEMFYPSYSVAVSTNPISGEKEYYMSVGLNSNIKESDFNRKKANVVIVLDISGSMSSSFDSYYYDGKTKSDNKSKMKIAEECVSNLIDKLNPDDRIGVVLFDNRAYVGTKIVEIGKTDTETLKSHILEVEAMGGTYFEAGYKVGTELFEGYTDDEIYENRIVVITDAMPNIGVVSSSELLKNIEQNAKNRIYTSFIGVGVDFNTKFTEEVSDVRGFNYFSVHSSEEFNKILAENFDYMITPLVFDLDLSFESTCYKIENVYGSDSVDKETGNIMHVNTLFPSASNSEGDVKGGIIVLKLKKIKEAEDGEILLKVSYRDASNKEHKINDKTSFAKALESGKDYYENLGIRKAIALARYVGVMKNWTLYEKSKIDEFDINDRNNVTEFSYTDDYIIKTLGINERASEKLVVSDNYKEIFKQLKKYIQEEKEVLKDDSLKNELDILDMLR